MSYDNARVFHAWLGDKLNELDQMHSARAAFEESQAAGQA